MANCVNDGMSLLFFCRLLSVGLLPEDEIQTTLAELGKLKASGIKWVFQNTIFLHHCV
jgi:hypothetical protein